MAQLRRSSDAQSLDPLQGLAQDFLVEKENGVESLVLSAGGRIAVSGQTGKKAFEPLLARKAVRHVTDCGDVMPEPVDVSRFSGVRLVLAPKDTAEPLNGKSQVHDDRKHGRELWTKVVPPEQLRTGMALIDEPAVVD